MSSTDRAAGDGPGHYLLEKAELGGLPHPTVMNGLGPSAMAEQFWRTTLCDVAQRRL
jgi:hypothetical protein